MARWALALAALLVSTASRADYLEIRRSAWLKKTPATDGAEVEKLSPDTLVALTSETQQNGYYRVKTREGKSGFVYRTLVRRHPGSLPAVSAPPADDSMPDAGPPPAGTGTGTGTGTATSSRLVAGQMRAHLIDVGQGAATLFEFSCGAVLIDTGGETSSGFSSADEIGSYLDRFFDDRSDLNRTLELVALTHAHRDHTENARLVGERYAVRNVVTNAATRGSGIHGQEWLREHVTQAHLETIKANGVPKGGRTNAVIDPVQCSDVNPKLTVLWGTLTSQPADWSKEEFSDDNNHSVVMRIDFGKAS